MTLQLALGCPGHNTTCCCCCCSCCGCRGVGSRKSGGRPSSHPDNKCQSGMPCASHLQHAVLDWMTMTVGAGWMQYRGRMATPDVLRAICAGYSEVSCPKPRSCMGCNCDSLCYMKPARLVQEAHLPPAGHRASAVPEWQPKCGRVCSRQEQLLAWRGGPDCMCRHFLRLRVPVSVSKLHSRLPCPC